MTGPISEGAPADVAGALKVTVHDYRSRSGQVFDASARQPSVPAPIRGEVSDLGLILGYQLMHRAKPPNIPLDVPRGGLTPPESLRTYNADSAGCGRNHRQTADDCVL